MKEFNRIVLMLLFVLINVVLFVSNLTEYISVNSLLFFNFIIITFLLAYHVTYNKISLIFSSFIVFNWLFFFIAPLLQLKRVSLGINFPNTMNFDLTLVLLGLSAVIIFNVVFFIFYFILQRSDLFRIRNKSVIRYSRLTFFAIIILSLLIVYIFSSELLVLIKSQFTQEDLSLAYNLILRKVLLSIIISAVLYYLIKIKSHRFSFLTILLLFVSLLILFMFKNPLLEKRNALGVIYLMLIFFTIPSLFSSNLRSFILVASSLLVVFPLSYFATHWRSLTSKDSFRLDVIFDNFYQLHYDAFSNLLAAIAYVFDYGITYGNQLFGTLFFFIPRSIWEEKPLNSGKMIGEYLMHKHSMWFDNLSMPFVGEAILNFGFVGIFVFPFFLAIIVVYFERLYYSNDFLIKSVSVYFAFHMIFLMRGDLTNAFAYFVGTVIGFFVIPRVINKICKIKLY